MGQSFMAYFNGTAYNTYGTFFHGILQWHTVYYLWDNLSWHTSMAHLIIPIEHSVMAHLITPTRHTCIAGGSLDFPKNDLVGPVLSM